MMNEYVQKFRSVVKSRIAVFIDAANLERSVKTMWVNPKDIANNKKSLQAHELRWAVDYQALKDFFCQDSTCRVHFYSPDFCTASHCKFLYFLDKRLKFALTTKPLKQYSDHTDDHPHRKANFDVEIATDATSLMHTFDTFVLFSGDCDFEYLIKFLRGNGKRVIGFSRSGHIAKELPPALSHYFDIVDFRSQFLMMKEAKSPVPNGTGPRS